MSKSMMKRLNVQQGKPMMTGVDAARPLDRLVMRYVLARPTSTGLELIDHFATHGEAMKEAANEHDQCVVVKASIEFAENCNVRKWDICA